MHRFHLSPAACRADEIVMTGREAHHALHVLRVRRGDRVVVLDGAGAELLCEVREPGREELALAVVQRNEFPPLPCEITLLQAIPKGRVIEDIVEKATELGISRVVPILSERTVVQLDGDSAEAKRQKWQQVAVEAIKQCGNPWLPQIEPALSPKEFLARGEKFDLTLVGSLQDDRRHPRECLRQFIAAQGRPPRTVCVWIGPEGDFTPAELHAIKGAGARPISLGPLILRSATAAIYSLAFLSYELQSGVLPAQP